ncbi:MAG: GTPase domain-containing protein [Methanomassiliicoccaceae archaeon]|nr:GTPase domain-containing protein [Methanomassiliicoccaceae archaeon]
MNRTNQALMGTIIGVAFVFAAYSFALLVMDIYGVTFEFELNQFYDWIVMIIPESVRDAYWSLTELYTDLGGEDTTYLSIGLFAIGFALVAAGCASRPTFDMKGGDDDPQEYIFTHKPKGFLWCLMIPWNILTVAWRLKKVPVILPIIFIPFMLPFALIMDVFLAVLFVIGWAFMAVRIKLAASKDLDAYEKDTQYAVCPRCKRNFFQPDIRCICGLVLSYPVPNKYGVKYHTCNRGHKIPSTNANGSRAKMQASCPFCKGDMLTHEAKPVAISMVGSVGSGKTTMMISAVETMAVMAKEKGIVSEIITNGISFNAQRGKANIPPTHAGELDSEYFFLRSRDLPEKQIIINDISGVEFQPDKDKILFEEYYRYNDGIILAIDPLEVMALYHSQSPTKGSKNTPVATLESFYHMYTEINGYGPAVKSTVPFAVVLTKMDDPKVRSAINAEDSPVEFLNKYGHKMVVDIAQSAFKNVRFFKVASLGENNNAVDPFIWILAENDKDLKAKMF